MNYFNVFNLPEKFKIDYKKLSKKLYQLQKKYHPDLFANLSKNVQKLYLEKSTLINQMYSVLKNPLKRGKYILFLHGIDINHQEHLLYHDETLLHEQFNLNVQLDKMKKQNSNQIQLNLFLKELKKNEKINLKNMEYYFHIKNWNKAKINLIKLMFLKKIINKTEKIIEDRTNFNTL
ncbi:Fe-S protein assembly co-chaperone HscB [Buchnera aphidicola (Hormaphis cornu)]|nr:Fe-S protein assembly co-chaperone HscB [Buchnera aphidicola (Hormaphis cornu)]